MTVEEAASLHEHTVQHAEDHAAAFNRPRKRTRKPRSTRVQVTRVRPDVLAVAKSLMAKRPGTRLRLVDAETVVVENIPPS